MPYEAKADSETKKWITLPEAVAYVRSADRCDEAGARRQLIAALADGMLGPLKWERKNGDKAPPFGSGAVMAPADAPPPGRDWLKAEIDWTTGRVRDDWHEFENGKMRVLLMLRHSIARCWPPSAPPDATTRLVPGAANSSRKTGPKTRILQSIANAMKKDIETKNLTIETLQAMPDKELLSNYGDRFGGQRTTCRDARKRALRSVSVN